mmetsp:Transcript_72516/g.235562  ORF Transcript_72516/g.235562 Transcript_72516/m.235562 type:complete len:296 (-) Transcript_72516:710-1597(-)
MVSQDFETTIAYRAVSSQRGSTPRLCLGHGRGRGAAGGQLGPLGVVEPILDVLHQLSLDAFQHCLLRRRYLPDGVNLLHARKAEGHLRGEEGHARASVGLEKAELVCLLTGQARQHGITEPPSGIGLRKRRALSSRGGACAGVFCAQLLQRLRGHRQDHLPAQGFAGQVGREQRHGQLGCHWRCRCRRRGGLLGGTLRRGLGPQGPCAAGGPGARLGAPRAERHTEDRGDRRSARGGDHGVDRAGRCGIGSLRPGRAGRSRCRGAVDGRCEPRWPPTDFFSEGRREALHLRAVPR